MIFKYLLLIAIFVSALVFRKKMMEHTVGAISRGFATLSGRVESWAKRQWETNPYSPYARAVAYYQFRKDEAWRKFYAGLKSTKNSDDDKRGGNKPPSPPRRGRETCVPVATRSEGFRPGPDNATLPEPDAAPTVVSGPVEYLPPGGVAVREQRDESRQQSDVSAASEFPVRSESEGPAAVLGWQEIPEPRQEGGVVAVFGPRGEDLPRLREPAHYDLLDENGAPGRVFGTWEGTPFGPAFRRHDVPESGLYQVVRTGAGKVGSRPLAESGGGLVPQPPRFDDSLSPNAGMFSARRASRGLSYQASFSAVDVGPPGEPGAEYGGQVAGGAVGRTGASLSQKFSQQAQVRKTPELQGDLQAVPDGRQQSFRGGRTEPLSQRPPQVAFKHPQSLGGQAEPFSAGESLRQTQIRRPLAQRGISRQHVWENSGRVAGNEKSGDEARELPQQRPQEPSRSEIPRGGETEPLSQRPPQVVFKPPKPLGGQAEAFPAERLPEQMEAWRMSGRQEILQRRGQEESGSGWGGDFSSWEFPQQRPQEPSRSEIPRGGGISQRPPQVAFKHPRQPDESTSQPARTKPRVRLREYPLVRGENVGERSEQSPPGSESS